MFRAILAAVILGSLLTPMAGAAPKSAPALTFHDCTFFGNYGEIVLVAYCPSAVPPAEVAAFVQATKGIWIAKYGFVQYRIFSTKQGVPMSAGESFDKSDAWFAKNEMGTALFNSATGAKRFWCKRTPTAELTDCIDLIR